jgi:hypothetical protein
MHSANKPPVCRRALPLHDIAQHETFAKTSNQPRNGDIDPLFTTGCRKTERPDHPARRVAPETQLSPFCNSATTSAAFPKEEFP